MPNFKIFLAFFILTTSSLWALEGKFRGLPALASSSETGLQVGGLLMYFFPKDPEINRISNVGFSVLASFKNQWKVNLFPDIYLTDVDHLDINFTFTYWPTNFYGIGNNTREEDQSLFLSKGFEFNGAYERHLFEFWWLGAGIDAGGESVEWDGAGIQDFTPIYGYTGSKDIGVGLTTSMDWRDHHNGPTEGVQISGEQYIYPEAIGSSKTYFYGNSHFKGFYSLAQQHVLGASVLGEWVMGKVPFRKLVSPDGAKSLRGVVNGRYRDRRHLAVNLEYRTPFVQDFGLVFFSDWAQVAPEWNKIKADEFHFGPGIGLRYAFNPEDHYNVRADFSYLDFETFVMTIYVKEAF